MSLILTLGIIGAIIGAVYGFKHAVNIPVVYYRDMSKFAVLMEYTFGIIRIMLYTSEGIIIGFMVGCLSIILILLYLVARIKID